MCTMGLGLSQIENGDEKVLYRNNLPPPPLPPWADESARAQHRILVEHYYNQGRNQGLINRRIALAFAVLFGATTVAGGLGFVVMLHLFATAILR